MVSVSQEDKGWWSGAATQLSNPSVWVCFQELHVASFPLSLFPLCCLLTPTGGLHWEIPVAGVWWNRGLPGAPLSPSLPIIEPVVVERQKQRQWDRWTETTGVCTVGWLVEGLTCDPTSSSGPFCLLLFQLTTNPGRQQLSALSHLLLHQDAGSEMDSFQLLTLFLWFY